LLIATASDAAAQGCLSYESSGAKLTGKIKRVTFPGPPNYESVKKGDQPEIAWVLRLNRPVCVKAGQDNEFDVAEGNVTDIQLVLEPWEFTKWRALAQGRAPVVVTGKLFHAHTGHHHTAVLMEVTNLKRQR
jgi:hypothetical protein